MKEEKASDICAVGWCHRRRVHPIHDPDDPETLAIGDHHPFQEHDGDERGVKKRKAAQHE